MSKAGATQAEQLRVGMEKRRRILFVCATILDNPNSTRYQRSRMLTSSYDTVLLCKKPAPKSLRESFSSVVCTKRWTVPILTELMVIAFYRFKGYRTIYTQYNIYAIIIGAVAKKLLGCTWIYDLWDHPDLEISLSKNQRVKVIKEWVYEKIARKALRSADIWIIAMSQGILQHLPEAPNTKIIKVTNGIELSDETGLDDLAAEKKNNVLTISYAGWVTLERGVSTILRYLRSSRSKDVEFILWGKTNAETVQALSASPDGDRARYLGVLTHADSLQNIQKSDICLCIMDTTVMNYRYSYHIKLFEYLAAGKVVIATETDASSEIIMHGQNGFLIRNTVEDLAGTIEQIRELRKDGRLTKIRRNARNTVLRYQWRDINAGLLGHLEDHLAGRVAP